SSPGAEYLVLLSSCGFHDSLARSSHQMLPKSPLAPAAFPELPAIARAELASTAAAIRYRGCDDGRLMRFSERTAVAGVFTRSLTAAAPVVWCRRALEGGKARGFLVNAGNANAFTGTQGMEAAMKTVRATARALGCREEEVFIASTGVIGEVLPDERITAKLEELVGRLQPLGWKEAAQAIMTTDTFPKGATCKARIGDVEVT